MRKLKPAETKQLTWGHSDKEQTFKASLPQNLPTTNWHLSIASASIKSWTACWPSTCPERNSGWRSRMKHSSDLGKTDWTSLQIAIFRRLYELNSSLSSERALKSLMVTFVPPDQQQGSAKMCAWLQAPCFTEVISNTPHAYLFGSFLELSEIPSPRL